MASYANYSRMMYDGGGGGSTSFDYDFVVDEGRLADVGSHMLNQADELRTKITELYKIIDEDLAQSWKSPAYDSFKETCATYKQGLFELANMIDVFGNSANEFSDAADTLLTNINSKFQ